MPKGFYEARQNYINLHEQELKEIFDSIDSAIDECFIDSYNVGIRVMFYHKPNKVIIEEVITTYSKLGWAIVCIGDMGACTFILTILNKD